MKVLIIQLARLGDIYLSWPTIRALRREFPNAKLDVLVRKSYSGALLGLDVVDHTFFLDSQNILAPLIQPEVDVNISMDRLTNCLDQLEAEGYDRIVNLSFSPLSSFITHYLSRRVRAQVSGYTRHSDATFNPNDDVSSYFYAQVGPGKSNRVHLTKIFSGVAGVDLVARDWQLGPLEEIRSAAIGAATTDKDGLRSITIHVGGSQKEKSLPAGKWANVVLRLLNSDDIFVIIVGDQLDSSLAREIETLVANSHRLINLVGQTTLPELFEVLRQTLLLIGPDSAPIHMASLIGLPTLNVSLPTVQFWETGPRAEGSCVVWAPSWEQMGSDDIASTALAMLNGSDLAGGAKIQVNDSIEGYVVRGYRASTFEWDLIQSIYMGGEVPLPSETVTWQGIENLHAINQLCMEQLAVLKSDTRNMKAIAVLDEGDRIFNLIYKLCPELRPLIDWFRTEKIRLGPGNFSDILDKTQDIHSQLARVTDCFLQYLGEVGAKPVPEEVHGGRAGLE